MRNWSVTILAAKEQHQPKRYTRQNNENVHNNWRIGSSRAPYSSQIDGECERQVYYFFGCSHHFRFDAVSAQTMEFTWSNDKGEVSGVKYDHMDMLLINAVKEQQAQIEAQQKQIARLLNANASLATRLRVVEKRLPKKRGSAWRRH